jgi:hypothetical protein
MKTIVLAAFAALILTAGLTQTAHAFRGEPNSTYHPGPYDNTQNAQKVTNYGDSDGND